MYAVMDTLIETLVGPFDTEEEAVQFVMEAESLVCGTDMTIYELTEPKQWAFDNLAKEIVDEPTQTINA